MNSVTRLLIAACAIWLSTLTTGTDDLSENILGLRNAVAIFPDLARAAASETSPDRTAPRMTQYVVPDPYLAMPAWIVRAPKDWIKKGGVTWTGGMTPAYYTDLSISNPQGSEEFRLFPIFLFAETSQPVLANGAEIRRVTGAVNAVRDIIIPRCRHDAKGVRIIAQEPLPKAVQEASARAREASLTGARIDAARVLVEYAANGRLTQEMYYCTVVAAANKGVTNWVIERTFSYRADKEKLESAFPVLGTIGGSLYENPSWIAARKKKLSQMVASRTRPPQISAGRGGPSILDVSKGMSKAQDDFLKGLNQSTAARDRATQPWTDAFRGVNPRQDPVTKEIMYVPNGYERYYQDNLGRKYGSNDMIGDPYVNYRINARELEALDPRTLTPAKR